MCSEIKGLHLKSHEAYTGYGLSYVSAYKKRIKKTVPCPGTLLRQNPCSNEWVGYILVKIILMTL